MHIYRNVIPIDKNVIPRWQSLSMNQLLTNLHDPCNMGVTAPTIRWTWLCDQETFGPLMSHVPPFFFQPKPQVGMLWKPMFLISWLFVLDFAWDVLLLVLLQGHHFSASCPFFAECHHITKSTEKRSISFFACFYLHISFHSLGKLFL